jgi:NAD(P)-dependent dehydrogenase (short-subunit alcohol dehydrogenase family)
MGAAPAESSAGDSPPLGIAHAVLFFVSDRASWLTGRNFIVDGGEFPMG